MFVFILYLEFDFQLKLVLLFKTLKCILYVLFFFSVSRFEFWFIGYQRFVCPDLEVTTGGMKQCHHKTELAKVVGHEFVEELFEHSRKIQSLKLTCDDIAVLRSFLVVSPGRSTCCS